MKKIIKFLKPFRALIFIVIALLLIQGLCELNLPNYMSQIVNVGIQQGGVESAAPDAISVNSLEFIKAFMTDDEKNLIDSNYALVSSDSYKKTYKNAETQIYVRNEDLTLETEQQLDKAFGTAAWIYYNEKTSIEDARAEAINTEESTIKQSGIMLSKEYYKELGADLVSLQASYILKIGMVMILVALLSGCATVLVSLHSSRIASGVSRNLRKEIFSKIESFSNDEFDKFSTASLITRCTNDVMQIQMLLTMGIRILIFAPIMGIGGFIMAMKKSVSMGWIIGIAIVFLIGMIIVIMSISMPKFKIIQKLVDRLNLVSRENLTGLMVIRAFGTQEHETKRFDRANDELTQTNLFVNRIMVFMMPVMMLIMNGTSVLIVWIGSHQIAASQMLVGDMMAYMQYAMQIIMSFLMISMMFIFVPRAAVSADRITEVLETEITINDPEKPQQFNPAKKGFVEFKDVSFRYHGADEDAIQNVSFTANPGETTAIIGSTGSGKTTLASLILRFYDVSSGKVIVDGVDVKEVTQKALREKIGYVPQKGVLISGTIESTIKYGNRDMSDKELEKAARVAQAYDFISEKPDGFNSEIAQGGGNVSGGQKQRLSIARALAKNPEIFIYDDSFSALDFKTDATLRKALKEHTGNSTVIVIAQRVSTILNAEQIIVMDNGKVVGVGTHKELLKSCPEYYEIASSQLSEEELA